MEREFDAYKLSRCMCPSNCNRFWDTARYWSKIVNFFIPPMHSTPHFYVPRPSFFVCPRDAPAAITQNVAWIKRQFSACQTTCSMYPSNLNSFPVIRTSSAKKSQFSHAAAHIFVSPGDALRLSRNMLHGWKDNSMLVKPLARNIVPIYIQ